MFKTFVNMFQETSPEALEKIELYYSLLVKWSKSLNLVQKETLRPEMFEMRHLIDCWQLIPHLKREQTILDVGSGAGLPGILLSIAGFPVDLVEQDMNKVAFLKNCKVLLNLNCRILPVDIYLLSDKYSQMTSRAFSQLNTLLQIQWNVSRETKGIFLKGVSYEKEIEEARLHWDFDFAVKNSLSADQGKIVIIHELKKKCFT
ncbi:MAG: 16S rRNA (guanine(527)-N(7))-methyltransferase RsmG [Pseudomonadota bacterium]